MLHATKNDTRLARRLAELTVQHGTAGVQPMVQVLKKLMEGRSTRQKKVLLHLYRFYLRREIRNNQVIVEHAGDLPDEALEEIRKSFSEKAGRDLEAVRQEKPDLIGGIRVTQGDNVYDATVAGRLTNFAASVR